MDDSGTLYDQIIQKLKNNKLVALILIAFAVVLGAAQFQGALTELIGTVRAPKIKVLASVQPYDFMGATDSSAKDLSPIPGDTAHLDRVTAALSEKILSALGATEATVEATLQLDGQGLHSTQPLQASVLVLNASPIAQVSRVAQDLGQADGLSLLPLFADRHFVNQNDNSVDMELVPQHGNFERQALKVFKSNSDLSFEPDQAQPTTVIRFSPHKPKIILAVETKTPQLESTRATLESALRPELQKHSLELRDVTLAQLENDKKTIQAMGGMGLAKIEMTNKHSIDYIVRITVLSE